MKKASTNRKEGGVSYVVPLIERIDVHVEKGFAASDDPENGGGGVTELTSYDNY